MNRHNRLAHRCGLRSDDGQVSAFVVTITLGILVLAGLSLDGGLALAAKVRANGHAESAARAGAQALDLALYRATGQLHIDPAQAAAEARRHLGRVGASGTVTVNGNSVIVTVDAVQPTQLLGLIGVPRLEVHGEGSAHPQRGVQTLEP
ncbi:pilus assembly protein TadG-related protein [Lentzea sp. HUAS12]|uniref:pilus assembly protein TadG-related protein n=1 Tax=Lentzea sp. HUAS12 TaxID=2951806 RepID=UPI0020A06EE5|nr:pilus assembly protein TadG-related protein [Lentzea sp. HUAS12]USX56427.1 pilus assembly protein TadG-related protein [Lentzea sp. HUAS12]